MANPTQIERVKIGEVEYVFHDGKLAYTVGVPRLRLKAIWKKLIPRYGEMLKRLAN